MIKVTAEYRDVRWYSLCVTDQEYLKYERIADPGSLSVIASE